MAQERNIADKCPAGTNYVLWYHGFKQCFKTLKAARFAQNALPWHDHQDSSITDADGRDVE